MSLVTDQNIFDALYYASRDPRILSLKTLNIADRYSEALKLQASGVVINEGVDLDGEDPFFYMRDLTRFGFVWQEAVGQQPLSTSNLQDYQDKSKAYPGSVKVSLDDADYPPFITPPTPVDHTSPIGPLTIVDPETYGVTAAFWKNGSPAYKEGQASTPFTSPKGATLYARYIPSGFGMWWAWKTA